eukprot:CAMPEP_0204635292 /NCGR_PEP_ID=MMETSP0717-20131115/31224_1 /ASSEMBLY_ACC=CAM_ASM_000666 /TAXON_ID=230516 /ORGANISM="Chaetoceros curvisetus" /LENGTH=101 /DNA_ID=CAMNT_0051653999 /DNA_START=70 /DNA_END=371 /DNA_ORIENTATION=+
MTASSPASTPASTPGLTVASIASSVTPASHSQHATPNTGSLNHSRSAETPWTLGSITGTNLGRSTLTTTQTSLGSKSQSSKTGVRVGMHVRESPSPGPSST